MCIRDSLDPVTQASSRFVDHAPIKGKKDVIEIYEIIWQESDVTTMATDVGKSQEQQDEVSLEVSYNKTSVVVNQEKSGLMMGRSKACDLPINEQLASRQHVKIELRRDKFFVIDQSTNGTHIKIDGGDESFCGYQNVHAAHLSDTLLGLIPLNISNAASSRANSDILKGRSL